MKMERIAAIIPAAGSGERLGSSESKAFLMLGSKPILIHALEKFQESPLVNELILVVRSGDREKARALVSQYGITKVAEITEGGQRRQDSVLRGLQKVVGHDIRYVLVHDAVRPFVTIEKTHELIEACRKHDAAVLAVHPKDTVKDSNSTPFVRSTLDRSKLWAVQTPQAFELDLLLQAYRQAEHLHLAGTDDSSLVEHLGVKVRIVEGSYDNIKITTREDLELAELILKRHGSHLD